MDSVYLAKQLNRAIQFLAQKLELSESEQMEIADLYPEWKPNQAYEVNQIIRYGLNSDGETQLYSIVQQHTSLDNWRPDSTPALYKAIGFTPAGYPIWTQPLGAHDAYQKGDIVSHNGELWISTHTGANTWAPSIYGWERYTA